MYGPPATLLRDLIKFVTCRDGRISIQDLANHLAMLDDHKKQHQRRSGSSAGEERCFSSAIRVDGVSAGTGPPFLGWHHTANNDVIDLGDITFAIVTLQDDTTDLEARSGNTEEPFNRETVVAIERAVRTGLFLISVMVGGGPQGGVCDG